MKKLLFIVMLMCTISHAQEKLVLTEEGVKPVVVQVEGKTAEELYSKAFDWANTFYNDPSKVIKGQVKNDYLRINAICGGCWKTTSLLTYEMDYRYNLIIEFQDGKFRFTYSIEELLWNGSPTSYTYKSFFNKKGVRKVYADSVKGIEESMNNTLQSLNDYISGKTTATKKDW